MLCFFIRHPKFNGFLIAESSSASEEKNKRKSLRLKPRILSKEYLSVAQEASVAWEMKYVEKRHSYSNNILVPPGCELTYDFIHCDCFISITSVNLLIATYHRKEKTRGNSIKNIIHFLTGYERESRGEERERSLGEVGESERVGLDQTIIYFIIY